MPEYLRQRRSLVTLRTEARLQQFVNATVDVHTVGVDCYRNWCLAYT